jgi:hypothetical protein
VKLANEAMFQLHVDKLTEGDGGAAVFCFIDPATRLRFHLDRGEGDSFRLRIEPTMSNYLARWRGR